MSDSSNFTLADGTLVRPSVPFFIAGSGRCGTTLMRRLLIERAHTVIPPENYVLPVSLRLMAMARSDWTVFCRLVLATLEKHAGRWEDFGIDAAAALPWFTALPAERRTVADFWHAFHALYARHVGRPSVARWGDKTPSSVDALPDIAGIFPQVRFIFMVRDVFDMAWSYGAMAVAGRAGDYLGGAQRWVDANAKILAFQPQHAAAAMFVRYEDLVCDAEREMQRVLAHLDVASSSATPLSAAEAGDIAGHPNLRNALHAVRSDTIGRGRAGLADDVKAAIAAIAAPLQRRLGYEPLGATPSPLPGR